MELNDADCVHPVRLLIVDSQKIYRESLCSLISEWSNLFTVAGIGASGREAFELYQGKRPDLTLMNPHLPVIDGPEVVRFLLKEFPSARIVMMAVRDDDPKLLEAIQFGACGYFLKETTGQQLKLLLLGYARPHIRSQNHD